MPKSSIEKNPCKNLLKSAKIVTLSKEEYKKFHKIRNLDTFVMGKHTLLSYQQKKYIQKVIPYSSTSHDKNQFLTTHPQPYYSLLPGSQSKTRTIIIPLLGESLMNLQVEYRWGKHIKSWIQRCGNIQMALLEAAKLLFYNYQNYGVTDISIQCYRVLDGRLIYVYDTWMNSTMETLKKLEEKAPFNLEQFCLSPSQLAYLSCRKTKKISNRMKQLSLSDVCKKICLFLLNFGVPEIKSRNYQFCQYHYNQQNIRQKIKFFKTRYSNRVLIQLIDKLWDHQNVVINDIWKLFDAINCTHNVSKSILGDSVIASKQNDEFQSFSIFVGSSEKQKGLCSASKGKKQNKRLFFANNGSNFSGKKSNSILRNHRKQNLMNNSQDKIAYGPNKSFSDQLTAQGKGSNQKLRLRNAYQSYPSVHLNTTDMSNLLKNKDQSILDFRDCNNKSDCSPFNLKKLLLETITDEKFVNEQLDLKQSQIISSKIQLISHEEAQSPKIKDYISSKKLIDYLGLTQYVPCTLYQQSVIKMLEKVSMMPDWVYQNYPNGSIYFGQVDNQSSNQGINKTLKRNGRGIYIFDSLDVYAGDWLNNCMHGQGSYIFKSGEHYDGQLQNGLKHGFGKFQYDDHRVYEGYWFKNAKVGMGTVYFPNNVKFFGYFNKGSVTQGLFSRIAQKQVLQHPGLLENYNWEQDKFSMTEKKQKLIQSKIKKCQLSTYIEQIDAQGRKYIGESQNNKYHGFGIQETSEQIYEGNWKAGEQSGEGKLIVKNKFEISGIWDKGILIQMDP